MGIAPYGYINRSHEDGKKYIAIKEPEASNIICVFNEIAKGHIQVVQKENLKPITVIIVIISADSDLTLRN